MELHSQVIGYLTTYADNNTTGRFQIDDIKDTLQGKLVEIQAVAHVVVGRNGLRVVVNHDGFVTLLACGIDGVDGTPVELHARTDAVGTRAKHNHRLLIIIIVNVVPRLVMLRLLRICRLSYRKCVLECRRMSISEVEVIGQFGMLAGHRIDTLHAGQYAVLFAITSHHQVLFFHIGAGVLQHETGYLEIAEAGALHF